MNTTAAPSTAYTTEVWAGVTPRLLRTSAEDLAQYRDSGGYRRLDDPAALLTEVELSGLLGRGGAAFPLAVKLASVRDRGPAAGLENDTVVVANGEEGEPASVKDRWLLRNRPHLILDGLRLVARVVAANHAHVYVSDQASADSVRNALAELDSQHLDGLTISVLKVDPSYVAGEESAAVRAINGGPAKPTDKPPRVFEEGVGGLPTLVSNVETLANVPFIHRHGAAEYRSQGTSMSPGTFLATITGAGRAPVLYELPFGVGFADLAAHHGVAADTISGVLMGGYFAGVLNREILDATLDHESVRRLGSGLGCGAIAILTDDCALAVSASVLAYFDRENAGQCGSCFNGTAAMAAVADALRDGAAADDDLARLERWSVVLRGRGACGTLDGAANVAASLLVHFPQVVQDHLAGDCPRCRAGAFVAQRPFEVETVDRS